MKTKRIYVGPKTRMIKVRMSYLMQGSINDGPRADDAVSGWN